jgi:hypothetical protein
LGKNKKREKKGEVDQAFIEPNFINIADKFGRQAPRDLPGTEHTLPENTKRYR